eukprot:TRINITY_DN25985_c0_g1_i2.p1 TRINITY_DN25985_c0_g1~~TRINITY_DN25985_c0_g1_i2.p1  ORF type:complete len:913 (+),score=165.23 TRINITY_DN25985_c0_g1_i2:76-2814(+)
MGCICACFLRGVGGRAFEAEDTYSHRMRKVVGLVAGVPAVPLAAGALAARSATRGRAADSYWVGCVIILVACLGASLRAGICGRLPAAHYEATAAAVLLGALFIDWSSAAVPYGTRGWPIALLVLDSLLVAGSRRWVREGCLYGAALWLVLVGFEEGYRLGLFQIEGWSDVSADDARSRSGCADPPCAVGADAATSAALYVICLYGDYAATRAVAEEQQQSSVDSSACVDAAEQVLDAFVRFDLQSAQDCLEAGAEELPLGLAERLGLLLVNLAGYKPYLPQSLFEDNDEPDETSCYTANSAPLQAERVDTVTDAFFLQQPPQDTARTFNSSVSSGPAFPWKTSRSSSVAAPAALQVCNDAPNPPVLSPPVGLPAAGSAPSQPRTPGSRTRLVQVVTTESVAGSESECQTVINSPRSVGGGGRSLVTTPDDRALDLGTSRGPGVGDVKFESVRTLASAGTEQLPMSSRSFRNAPQQSWHINTFRQRRSMLQGGPAASPSNLPLGQGPQGAPSLPPGGISSPGHGRNNANSGASPRMTLRTSSSSVGWRVSRTSSAASGRSADADSVASPAGRGSLVVLSSRPVVQRRVTILWRNRRGFLQIVPRIRPEQLSALIAADVEAFSAAVQQQKGMVDVLCADHSGASFGAVRVLAGHREHAVRCAAALNLPQDALRRQHSPALGLNRRSGGSQVPGAAPEAVALWGDSACTAAVCSGEALCGDFGSFVAQRFMVIGAVSCLTLVAERAAAAWDVPLLIDEAVHGIASTTWECRMRSQVTFPKRGSRAPFALWEVICEKDTPPPDTEGEWMYQLCATDDLWEPYNEGVTAWCAGDIEGALAVARRALAAGATGCAVRNDLLALLQAVEAGAPPPVSDWGRLFEETAPVEASVSVNSPLPRRQRTSDPQAAVCVVMDD